MRATVTSPSNPAVKAARKLARGTGRRPGRAFLVEGPQAVREARGHLRQLFATEAALSDAPDVVGQALEDGVELVPVAPPLLAALASTVSPQGLVGVAELPSAGLDDALAGARLVVVPWEVRDPGNVGAIIRSADAAGADAVVLAGSCVDPRNGKAVRASAGSLFHLPVAEEGDWAVVAAACRRHGLRLVAADAAAPLLHTEADLARPTALVLGNEARGIPEEVLATCDEAVRVPIHGRAESLNLAAAAAVLLYEAARQGRGAP